MAYALSFTLFFPVFSGISSDDMLFQRLYTSFNENQYPEKAVKEYLAKELGITVRQVCAHKPLICVCNSNLAAFCQYSALLCLLYLNFFYIFIIIIIFFYYVG